MGVMDPTDYPFSWVRAVMPESISGRVAEFRRRALYVRNINNWIKAGRTKVWLCSEQPPIQLLMPPGEARACTCPSVLFSCSSFLAPSSRHRSADNFLIAELDVGEGVILPIESNRAQQCDDRRFLSGESDAYVDIRNLLHGTNFYGGI